MVRRLFSLVHSELRRDELKVQLAHQSLVKEKLMNEIKDLLSPKNELNFNNVSIVSHLLLEEINFHDRSNILSPKSVIGKLL